MSPKVQPYVLAVGGGNGSYRLTGLWQTVRGASSPITANNCYENWWSEKYTTTGRRRWLPARGWTNDCTAHDQATPEPKVKVPYWHLECQNYVSNRQDRTGGRWTPDYRRRKRGRPRETWKRTIEAEMKTAGKTWKELEKAAMDREQWKSLVSVLCAT